MNKLLRNNLVKSIIIKNNYTYLRNFCTNNNKKKYLENHEWLLKNKDNNNFKIGIDSFAQDQLGDIIYIDFNVDENDLVKKDNELVFIESVKAVGTITSPFDCKIIKINENLENNLDKLNEFPEDELTSWFIELKKN